MGEAAKQSEEKKDLVTWIKRNFYIPETKNDPKLKGRIGLEPYQEDTLREILSTDENGDYKYSTVVWSDIKKSYKCVHPYTKVSMANGDIKRACDIHIGDYVSSYHDGKYVSGRVLASELQEKSPMYRISTSRGREIIVTGEHPFLVNGNNIAPSLTRSFKKSIKTPFWKKANLLEIGDRVVVGLGWIPHVETSKEFLDEMYLLGAYIGDGGQGTISTSDPEIVSSFSEKFSLTKKGEYGYYLKGAADWLRKWGILSGSSSNHRNYSNSYTKRVPGNLSTFGVNAVSEFLSGYFDTDGNILNTDRKQPALLWVSVNYDLLQDCQLLLSGIGINAALFRSDATCNGKVFIAYRLAIYGTEQFLKIAKLLKPRIKHKRENLENWIKIINSRNIKKSNGISLYSSDKVVSIEVLEMEYSIAIEVENFHNHITNGLVTHNSTIAAAVNLARAWHEEWGEHYVIANDLKQADSRVAHYLRRAIQLNPAMSKKVRTPGYRINLPSGSFIEAIPIDPSGEAGTNADMITFSELWGANEDAKANMWAEMTIPPGKHGKAFRWIESYAGFVGESKLLYSLYETGVKRGRLLWPDKLYHVNDSDPAPLELYVNDDARMIVLWNTKPRCPTQTAAYYKTEASILLPAQFQRMHRNQWISSTETFVPMEWLYACKRKEDEWPQWGMKYMEGEREKIFLQRSHPMIIAADAGVSDDNFGLWMGCRHPTIPDNVLQVYIKKWEPPIGGKIDFQGTEENPGPEREIRRLIKNYNVVEVCYDPHQLYDLMNRLAKEELSWFKPFNQGDKRLVADSGIRGLIRDRKYWYRGEKDFEEHVQNSDAQIDTEDTKIRIVKRAEQLKVDLLVAASMGSFEVLRLNL